MFSSVDVQIAAAVLQWANEYLCIPNDKMRRTNHGHGEAVCPFVKAALESNSFYVDICREINGHNPGTIVEAMLKYRDRLRAVPPFHSSELQRKAIVVVFPEITAAMTPVLDLAQAQIKSAFVREGLMVTQCYPGCDMRSVRNPGLRVYESPYPLMALRMMAIHDILFISEDQEWFTAYHLRFGNHFRDPKTLQDYEQPLLEAYAHARARFIKAGH